MLHNLKPQSLQWFLVGLKVLLLLNKGLHHYLMMGRWISSVPISPRQTLVRVASKPRCYTHCRVSTDTPESSQLCFPPLLSMHSIRRCPPRHVPWLSSEPHGWAYFPCTPCWLLVWAMLSSNAFYPVYSNWALSPGYHRSAKNSLLTEVTGYDQSMRIL